MKLQKIYNLISRWPQKENARKRKERWRILRRMDKFTKIYERTPQ